MAPIYTFSSDPAPAVTLTISDGRHRLAMTQPLPDVAPDAWDAFRDSGFADPDAFIAAQPAVEPLMRHAAAIMNRSLEAITLAEAQCRASRGFIDYALSLIAEETRRQPRSSRARKYATVARRFARYLRAVGLDDIPIPRLDAAILADFDRHLLADNVKPSTVAFNNRILRAIYNRATAPSSTTAPAAQHPAPISPSTQQTAAIPPAIHGGNRTHPDSPFASLPTAVG